MEWPAPRFVGQAIRYSSLVTIAFLIDGFGVGGTELNAARTLEALARRNVHVIVMHFQSDGPLFDRLASSGHRMIHIPVAPLWSPRIVPRIAALAKVLQHERAHVVHSQDVYSNIIGTTAALLTRRPILTSRRWKDEVPRAVLTPLNAWAHRRSQLVLPNSTSLISTLRNEGVPESRICVHENFIDDSALIPLPIRQVADWRSSLGIPIDALVVGCVARLSRVKRHDVLIEAFALIAADAPHARLVLVGDGGERVACEALVAARGLKAAVHFTGTLPNSPLPQHLFDISVLTSDNEGFPNALVESAACSKPLVATMVGGVTDVLQPDQTGFAVDVGDVRGTADAIRVLLTDVTLRCRMGDAGRDLVASRFSESAAMTRLAHLYQSTTPGRTRA